MQLVDFNGVFKTLKGEDVKDEKGVVLTLGELSCNLLVGMQEDDKNLSGLAKVKRYKLAQRISGAKKPVELEAEEITLLKDLFGKNASPLIVGQAYEWLDPPVKE